MQYFLQPFAPLVTIISDTVSYICVLCTKTFSQADSLQTQQRTNTGVKPYLCKECTKTFSDADDLQNTKEYMVD